MKSIAKAIGLFVVLSVVLMTFCEKFLKEEPTPTSVPSLALSGSVEHASIGAQPEPPPAIAAQALESDYAKVCAGYDTIAHPEQVADILVYASAVTHTPAGALYGVWRNETGNVDGAGLSSGSCPVMAELEIRDGAAGSHHRQGMLAMADVFGWKTAYGAGLERMTCSCPNMDKETHERMPHSYGGSCGPFQFSGEEVDDEYAIPQHLDPMTFCGGALIAGWELKKHHDFALAKGYASEDGDAWRWAFDRYLGNFDGHYSRGVVANWDRFQQAYVADAQGMSFLQQMIKDQTRGNVQYLKGLYASAP